ncbi:MAG TPA: hypothetical protein VE866_04485 [Candidatus Binatia bacterium]|jgi:hypothetical protein|nr:hypothetical protein [Candidatus Binatia bacterium]
MKAGGSLSIWFFTGVCLLVNGALICATGIYELVSPPADKVVLYDLHANIWWGGVLFVVGLIYSLRYSPARERARAARNS